MVYLIRFIAELEPYTFSEEFKNVSLESRLKKDPWQIETDP